jgi:hypothetical protein
MQKEVGLWIDHQLAVIVTLKEKGEDIQHIKSHAEPRVHYHRADINAEANTPKAAQEEAAREKRVSDHITHYYDEIMTYVRDATSVFIVGPDEAKIEFQQHLESETPAVKVLGVETANTLSDADIVSKIRANFEYQNYTH